MAMTRRSTEAGRGGPEAHCVGEVSDQRRTGDVAGPAHRCDRGDRRAGIGIRGDCVARAECGRNDKRKPDSQRCKPEQPDREIAREEGCRRAHDRDDCQQGK